jgi:ribosomal protein S18 acetylase RimI-like enzyme
MSSVPRLRDRLRTGGIRPFESTGESWRPAGAPVRTAERSDEPLPESSHSGTTILDPDHASGLVCGPIDRQFELLILRHQRTLQMITYQINATITPDQFVDILRRSGLAERRPIDDAACMAGMLANGNLSVTAWDGAALVGIARSVTDFVFCCYLSDLAVDRDYQRRGIGRQLIARTQAALGQHAKLVLLAAPKAVGYYPHIGMQPHPQAWVLERGERLISQEKNDG